MFNKFLGVFFVLFGFSEFYRVIIGECANFRVGLAPVCGNHLKIISVLFLFIGVYILLPRKNYSKENDGKVFSLSVMNKKGKYYDLYLILTSFIAFIFSCFMFRAGQISFGVFFGLAGLYILLNSKINLYDLEVIGFTHGHEGKKFVWGLPRSYKWTEGGVELLLSKYTDVGYTAKSPAPDEAGTIVIISSEEQMNEELEDSLIKQGFERGSTFFWKSSRLGYSIKNSEKLGIEYKQLIKQYLKNEKR